MHATTIENDLIARCRAEEDTLTEVRCVLRNQLIRAGLADIDVPAQLQSCRLITDEDGSRSLVGEWRKQRGKIIGSVVIHENGELFAELGVLQPAPNNPRMRVESVVAFGAAGSLQAELRMTPSRD